MQRSMQPPIHNTDGSSAESNDNGPPETNSTPFDQRPTCLKCFLPPHDQGVCPFLHCRKCQEWGHTKDTCHSQWKCTKCKGVVSMSRSLYLKLRLTVIQGSEAAMSSEAASWSRLGSNRFSKYNLCKLREQRVFVRLSDGIGLAQPLRPSRQLWRRWHKWQVGHIVHLSCVRAS